MRAFILTIFVFLTIFSPFSWSQENGIEERLNKIVLKFVGSNLFQGNIHIRKDDMDIFKKSYGHANLEHSILNKKETIFMLGSISKQFTATGILKLQEEGLLKVEDKIRDYLNVPESWKDITIHHLLTHTAALKRDTNLTSGKYSEHHSLEMLFDDIIQSPLLSSTKPGDKWSYSNAGYSALAYLIEVLTKKPYGQFLKDNFFSDIDDLGLYHQSIILKDRASSYVFYKDVLYNSCCFDYSNLYGAGSTYGTTESLLMWFEKLLNNDVISQRSIDLLFTRHIKISTQSSYYGYGWSLGSYGQNRTLITHSGSVNGYHSIISYIPEDKLKLVIFTNRVDQNIKDSFYLDKMREALIKELFN